MMKPILFSTEMVQAILEDRKSQTRRIAKVVFLPGFNPEWTGYRPIIENGYFFLEGSNHRDATKRIKIPYQVGDTLWVRETWYYEQHMHDLTAGEPDLPSGGYSHRYVYRASSPDYPVNVGVGQQGWSPSIFMPKEAARIFLKVKDVRVERLQDITEEDVKAEGVPNLIDPSFAGTVCDFKILWDSLYAKKGHGWDKNDWVFVYEFERTEVAGHDRP